MRVSKRKYLKKSLYIGMGFLVFPFFHEVAFSAEFSYKCTIVEHFEHDLGEGGDAPLKMKSEIFERKNMKVTDSYTRPFTFEVSRETGRMKGYQFDNEKASEVKILGNSNESLKILSQWNDYSVVEMLSIKGYVEGSKKPFTAISTLFGVFAGYCE